MTELILDSLQRRMAAMHSLYYQAVDTMELDHVNHFEREGVLPIAFSLFHYTNMEDASFMVITGIAPIWNDGLAGPGAAHHQRPRQAPHRRRDDPPAHRRLRRVQGVPTRGVRPHRGLARPSSTRPSSPGARHPAVPAADRDHLQRPRAPGPTASPCSTPPSAGSTSTGCATWARSSWPAASSASVA